MRGFRRGGGWGRGGSEGEGGSEGVQEGRGVGEGGEFRGGGGVRGSRGEGSPSCEKEPWPWGQTMYPIASPKPTHKRTCPDVCPKPHRMERTGAFHSPWAPCAPARWSALSLIPFEKARRLSPGTAPRDCHGHPL